MGGLFSRAAIRELGVDGPRVERLVTLGIGHGVQHGADGGEVGLLGPQQASAHLNELCEWELPPVPESVLRSARTTALTPKLISNRSGSASRV